MAAQQKRYPERIRFMCSLPWQHPKLAVAELKRTVDELGAVGVMVLANIDGVSLTDRKFSSIWREIDRRGLPVLVHPTAPPGTKQLDVVRYNLIASVGFMFDTQLMVVRLILNGIFERYPNFPFLVAHTGAGLLDIKHRLRGAHNRNPDSAKNMKKPFDEYLKGLYFDTCMNDHEVLMDAFQFMGPDRLMWGTDYPFVDNDTKQVEGMEIGSAQKQAILGDNAEKIFKL